MTPRRWLAALAGVLIALALYWWLRGRGDDPAPHAASAPTATVAPAAATDHAAPAAARPDGGAHAVQHTPAERTALLAAIARAREQRPAAPAQPAGTAAGAPGSGTKLDILDRTGDTSAWEKRALDTLNTLLGECYDLGRAEDPKLAGTVTFRFKLAGEPKVGGLLERVDFVEEQTSIQQATLRDCMSQQLYALELDPPPDGVQVEREVSLKFP